MTPVFPMRVLISRVSAFSQTEFAAEAKAWVPDTEKTHAEISPNGLIAHHTWEPDLEAFIDILKKHSLDLKIAKPEINFIYEPGLLEPFYLSIFRFQLSL